MCDSYLRQVMNLLSALKSQQHCSSSTLPKMQRKNLVSPTTSTAEGKVSPPTSLDVVPATALAEEPGSSESPPEKKTSEFSQVLPGLYVGNFRDAKDQEQLRANNITHIISIHDNAKRVHEDKEYLCIQAADTPGQNLSQFFSRCNDFIHRARACGGNVLIHCLAGVSRSVTIAAAYVMSVTSLSCKDSLKVLRGARSIANPNCGFQKQLHHFEFHRLVEERKRLRERYPQRTFVEDEGECKKMLVVYHATTKTKEPLTGVCRRYAPPPSPSKQRSPHRDNSRSS